MADSTAVINENNPTPAQSAEANKWIAQHPGSTYQDWQQITSGTQGTVAASDLLARENVASGSTKLEGANSKYQQFYDAFSKPPDPNDPMFKSIMNSAANAASNQAAGQGIVGGAANANTEQAVAGALTPYELQRQQMAFNAVQGQSMVGQAQGQLGIGGGQLALGQNEMNLGVQSANAAAGAGTAGTIGSITGGAIGAIGGAYLGGPAGAAAGLSAGSALGGGVGRGIYGATNPQPFTNPYGLGNNGAGASGNARGGY